MLTHVHVHAVQVRQKSDLLNALSMKSVLTVAWFEGDSSFEGDKMTEKNQLSLVKEDELINENHEYLSQLDEIGYNEEYHDFKRIQGLKLGKYLSFHNPWNKHRWKLEIGNGVDFVFVVGDYKIYVEKKYCQANYPIRTQWFNESVLPRFKNCPAPDRFNIYVVECNKPQNYNPVKTLAAAAQIRILTFQQLISLIHSLLSIQYTTTHNSAINKQERVTSLTYSEIRSEVVLEMTLIKKIENERLKVLYSG